MNGALGTLFSNRWWQHALAVMILLVTTFVTYISAWGSLNSNVARPAAGRYYVRTLHRMAWERHRFLDLLLDV